MSSPWRAHTRGKGLNALVPGTSDLREENVSLWAEVARALPKALNPKQLDAWCERNKKVRVR